MNDRGPDPLPRRILGNLDAELDFAAQAPDPASPGQARRPRRTLSRAARRSSAAAATLLRALARDGDHLHLLAPIAFERLTQVPGLPRPVLESGELAHLPPAAELLAWAATERSARLRRRGDERPPASPPSLDGPLHEVLWRLPPASPAAAAHVHHRAFALAVAQRLGCALPGARMIDTVGQLEAHLAVLPAGAAGRPWILKAPQSAAGRDRLMATETPPLAKPRIAAIERLLARHGSVLFEPWMDRTDDFGVAALVTSETCRVVGIHRSAIGPRGSFLGLEAQVDGQPPGSLSGEELSVLQSTVTAVAAELGRAGYCGPFGIDCWRYRTDDGQLAWHPLGEINGRMTLGLLAHALVARIREPLKLTAGATCRLRLAASAEASDPPRLTLLEPDRDHAGTIWLELL